MRRRQGERFDPAELQKSSRSRGARASACTSMARACFCRRPTPARLAETARPFDTVYVSLYKYFNAASGAILAGPRDLLDDMFHARRMFGGGIAHVWPFAAVALHYLAGFGERYGRAVRVSQDLMAGLRRHGGFTIDPFPMGTNLFRLKVRTTDAATFRKRLAASGVMLSAPQGDTFLIGVNETLNRMTAADLTEMFTRAL